MAKKPTQGPFALSIKQPWAALIVHGLKTIEVRRWATSKRRRILIHAARVPDNRKEAWQNLPADVTATAQLRGGVIGAAELTDCRRYRNVADFLLDQPDHYNEESWFEPPELFGFVLTKPEIMTFQEYPGWFRFFQVDQEMALP